MLKNKMNKRPLVSIILPTYNREKYIKRAINSALNQTYKNLELIIIDDSSNNKIANIIFKIKKADSRVIYIRNESRLGFVKSLNKGIRMAKGKYIARLDSDDFWCDQKKLEKQVNFLENHPDYVLVGGRRIVIDKTGKELFRCLLPENDEEIRRTILFDSPFVHGANIFRKNVYELVGGYDEQLNYCEDWDLWLRMGKLGKMYNFQDYFVHYLQAKQNRSNRQQDFKLGIKLRKKYRNDYPFFYKAMLSGWIHYFYSFFPFQKPLHPISSRLKKIILSILKKQ